MASEAFLHAQRNTLLRLLPLVEGANEDELVEAASQALIALLGAFQTWVERLDDPEAARSLLAHVDQYGSRLTDEDPFVARILHPFAVDVRHATNQQPLPSLAEATAVMRGRVVRAQRLVAGDRRGLAGNDVETLAAYVAEVPDDLDGRLHLARAMRDSGDLDRSIVVFREVLVRASLPGVDYELAQLLRAGGDLEGALASFRRAATIVPLLAEAHHHAALILRSRGRGEEARAEIDQAERVYRERVAADETDREAVLRLGAVCAFSGRRDEARVLLRQALAAAPNLRTEAEDDDDLRPLL